MDPHGHSITLSAALKGRLAALGIDEKLLKDVAPSITRLAAVEAMR